MDIGSIAANLGAALTTGLGALGLLAPQRAAAFASLSPIIRTQRVRTTGGFGCSLRLMSAEFVVIFFSDGRTGGDRCSAPRSGRGRVCR